MSDKERLEKIEAKYSILIVSSEENDTEYTEVNVKDLVFLIQNAFKQAKRVDRLESHSYNAHLEILKREQQIERYREAINNIIKKAMLFGVNEEVYDAIQDAIKVLDGEEDIEL